VQAASRVEWGDTGRQTVVGIVGSVVRANI
jgi:hypothetical protein